MRLIVITNLFPNPMEPQYSTFNEQQIAALAVRIPISVICPVGWVRKLKFVRTGGGRQLRRCKEWKGIPVRYPTYFYMPRILGWIRGLSMTLSIAPSYLRVKRITSATAILATWLFPDAFAAMLLGRLTGLPVVIKVHGSDVEALQIPGWQRRLALWGIQRASAIITVSRYLRDALIRQGVPEEVIHVVYNGIDTKTFRMQDRQATRSQLGLARESRLVLFVGSLKHDKGVRELMDPQVVEACLLEGASIAIAGTGPLRAELEQKILERGLTDRVTLLGSIPPAQVALWMNAADLLCLPSHHEGLPNVVLEALACGIPVVATRVGGIPEIVDDRNGRLVEPQAAAPLAAAVLEVLRSDWCREDIAETCPAGAWQENAATLEELIRSRTEATA